MSMRWLYIIVALVEGAAIIGRLGFALSGAAPLFPKSALPGGTTSIFVGYSIAAILYFATVPLLISRNPNGFMCFVLAVIVDTISLDKPYPGQPLALIVMCVGALYAYNRSRSCAKL